MSALVLQQAISILPVKKERIEMPTYKVYSKKFEIAKFEELSISNGKKPALKMKWFVSLQIEQKQRYCIGL